MKKILIFCISLNVALAAGLGLVFFLGHRERLKQENERKLSLGARISESVDMLEKAGELYADKRYLDARVRLRMALFRLYEAENQGNAEIIGMGEWYFFESGEENKESEDSDIEFFKFIGAVRSLVQNAELTEEETEIIEKIKASHAGYSFSHTVYPSLTEKTEISEKDAQKRASELLGEKVLISARENTLFPLCYTFVGKNTFAAVSVLGGRLIKMYFYPGETRCDISREEAVSKMQSFMKREHISDVEIEEISCECGVYYASFCYREDKRAKILMAVKGSGGRVCMFDAEEFYKYYRS